MISDVIKTGMIDGQPANMSAILNVRFYLTRKNMYQNALSACAENAYCSPMKLYEDNLRTAVEHIQSDLFRLEEYDLYKCLCKQCFFDLSESMLLSYIGAASKFRNRFVPIGRFYRSNIDDQRMGHVHAMPMPSPIPIPLLSLQALHDRSTEITIMESTEATEAIEFTEVIESPEEQSDDEFEVLSKLIFNRLVKWGEELQNLQQQKLE